MEKINSFKISELSVRGFKCFAEPQTFLFGGMNAITGHNGQGKSTLAEAITYAITGVPFFGSENSLDRLYTMDTKDAAVELLIELPDGTSHRLTRCRANDRTDITYDGIPIRQSDLTVMFGEKDVFLSIFNPLYFIEELEDRGRNLLERYLPAIPHETVMAKLCDSHQTLLGNVQMHSPEALLDKVRGDIRELESSVVYVEGQRDLLSTQAQGNETDITQKNNELRTAKLRAEELAAKKTSGLNLSDMKERLVDLYARYEEMAKDAPSVPDTAQIDTDLFAVSGSLEERRAAVYVSPYTQATAEVTARFDHVKNRYTQENGILTGLKPGIRCPVCKQEVTEQNFSAVKQTFQDSINSLLEEGRNLKGQLAELNELDAKALAVFEQYRADDIAKLETQIADLQYRRATLLEEVDHDVSARSSEMNRIKGEIQTLELDIEMGNLTDEEARELTALGVSIKELEAEIGFLGAAQDITSHVDKEKDIESLKTMIAEKKELENAVRFYISERVNLRFSDFDLLQRTKIVLYNVVKSTGEVKNTFQFSYDDKPYRYLSLSEKIKAGLEVSELMKRLTNSDYPVFIDNGESVPVIDNIRPSGQVFISQVVKAAPLTVQILDGSKSAQKVAA